jgi:hypothetical protein
MKSFTGKHLIIGVAILLSIPISFKGQNAFDFNRYSHKLGSGITAGTGFIINKDGSYYLVSALHVLIKDTLSDDFLVQVPSYEQCRQSLRIYKYGNQASNSINDLVHLKALSNRDIYFSYIKLSESVALDLAVIKIKDPSEYIKNFSLDFNDIDTSIRIKRNQILKTVGFPYSQSIPYILDSKKTSKKHMRKFEKRYSFYFPAKDSLEGMSGSPVYDVSSKKRPLVKGMLFLSGKRNNKYYGFVIYAKYLAELIYKIDNPGRE